MNRIEKLTDIFRQFPGIGPRQAKRFVYFLLTRQSGFLDELSSLISDIKKDIKTCNLCFRIFTKNGTDNPSCQTCSDINRDSSSLLVVEKDVDLDTIEKSHEYKGFYFVLGGSIPILEKEPEKRVRLKELMERIGEDHNQKIKEIILAFSLNADGENTREYVEHMLSGYKEKGLRVLALGRGLSTGSELEYLDSETIKNALKNRQ